MTVVMVAVMVPLMLGMMFFMHRGHGKHKDHGGEKPPVEASTATAPGAQPSEHAH